MMNTIYERIRARRIQLGLTQDELAHMVGYHDRTSIAKIEAGKVDIQLSKLIALAGALKMLPQELLGWDSAEADPSNDKEQKIVTLYRNASKKDQTVVDTVLGLDD